MESKVPLVKNTYFWISLGLIIPNLIGLFLHFTGKKIETTDKVLFVKLNMVHDLFQIVGFILIAVGFYYARYTKYLPQKTTTLLPPQ